FYVLCIGLFNGMITASLDFLSISNGWFYLYGDILASLTGIFALLFCMHFLHTSENSPGLHKILVALLIAFILTGFLPVFGFISAAMAVSGIVSFIASIFILIDSFYIYFKGFKP